MVGAEESAVLSRSVSSAIGGYVLAGGRSSRMGSDKALLRLAGRPLVDHAVSKLRRVCSDVHIVVREAGRRPELDEFAPPVPDLHPGCGPIAGIEAALMHSRHEWNLILPVDVPLLPLAVLEGLVDGGLIGRSFRRVAMFRVFGDLQPAILLVHTAVAPFLTQAIARGEYTLIEALKTAARELAPPGVAAGERETAAVLIDEEFDPSTWMSRPGAATRRMLTPAQLAARRLWFANLNTPAEFALAEEHIAALDP